MSTSEKVPRVSVLMSVYNGERFLRDSVESILGQTFTDFEFLILDDGSTDSTCEILEEYANKDARIVLVRNDRNLGLTRSLNKGLRLVRGEYLARQDADDISLPKRLEMQVKFLDAHPEVGVVGSALEIIDENGNTIPYGKHGEVIVTPLGILDVDPDVYIMVAILDTIGLFFVDCVNVPISINSVHE